jgi:prepilin-type processing-associated H-X9-DG protein
VRPVDFVMGLQLLGLGGTVRGTNWFVTIPPLNDSEVVSPSEMMAIGDGFTGNNGIINVETWVFGRNADVKELYPGSTAHAYSRHSGKADVVFCDGHVESPSFNALFNETGDAALSRWNRDHQPHGDRLGL